MSFGVRHYQLIAKAMQAAKTGLQTKREMHDYGDMTEQQMNEANERAEGCENCVLEAVASELAGLFAADNPGFDRQFFLQACEPNAPVIRPR